MNSLMKYSFNRFNKNTFSSIGLTCITARVLNKKEFVNLSQSNFQLRYFSNESKAFNVNLEDDYDKSKSMQSRPVFKNNNNKFVYVLDIPTDTNWKQLKEFMREAGEVSYCEIKESTDGKIYAKVRFENAFIANTALEILNKQTFLGKVISVVGTYENEKINKSRAYIYNLKFSVTSDQVFEHLAKFADVTGVRLLIDSQGNFKGSAIAEFSSEEEATKAIINAKATLFEGRLFLIREDRVL